MKKATLTVSYDEEKLSTLKLYLEQKGVQIEDEIEQHLDTLFAKTVPAGVREFLKLRSGETETVPPKPKKIKNTSGDAEVKTNAQP